MCLNLLKIKIYISNKYIYYQFFEKDYIKFVVILINYNFKL